MIKTENYEKFFKFSPKTPKFPEKIAKHLKI